MAKKINTEDLVKKIEKITRDRIVKENVVDLKQYRDLKTSKPPVLTSHTSNDNEMHYYLSIQFFFSLKS